MIKLTAVSSPSECSKAARYGTSVMSTGWSAGAEGLYRPRLDVRCDIICVNFPESPGDGSALPDALASECKRVGANAVFFDFDSGDLSDIIGKAASALMARGFEAYAPREVPAPGLIITDGDVLPHQKPPRAVFLKYRRTRTVMYNTGAADKHDLSEDELASIIASGTPRASYSPELSANYFTLRDKDKSFFIVYDDNKTIQARLELAESRGYQRCFMLLKDIAAFNGQK